MGDVIQIDGRWINSRTAADMMGVSLRYIHRLNDLGAIVPQKIGRDCWYRRRDIEDYIASHPRLGKAVAAAG